MEYSANVVDAIRVIRVIRDYVICGIRVVSGLWWRGSMLPISIRHTSA
jgi:hypothetical protein